MSSPQDWFKALPPFTRYYFATALATTIGATLGIITPNWIVLDFPSLFYRFHIWRPITCFIYFGAFGFPFIIQMFILTRYLTSMEQGFPAGPRGTAEMTFFVAFTALCMIAISYFWENLRFPGPALVFSALYVWSRRNAYLDVVFWGFKFQAWTFPFVILVLAFLGLGSPMQDLVGLIVGHLYHFLVDIVPSVYGVSVLKTPEFLYRLFESGAIRQPRQQWMQGAGYSLGS